MAFDKKKTEILLKQRQRQIVFKNMKIFDKYTLMDESSVRCQSVNFRPTKAFLCKTINEEVGGAESIEFSNFFYFTFSAKNLQTDEIEFY